MALRRAQSGQWEGVGDVNDKTTTTTVAGYPKAGPYGSELEAEAAVRDLPLHATVLSVREVEGEWWINYIETTTTATTLLELWEREQ